MGCLFAPFRFLKWTFTNGWKGLIVLVIVAAIIVGVVVGIKNGIKKATVTKPTTTVVDSTIPNKFQAPYIVVTPSRYYYAKKAVKKDGITTLTGYWVYESDEWVAKSGQLVMGQQYGKVVITKR